MKKMYGIIAAMTTPFLEDGTVDVKALEQETEFLIRSGVDCLYPCGTTGEMLLMTCEQREQVAETVIRKAAGRVIVFIHTGAVRMEDTIRLSRHASQAGADGIGVVTPSFFGMTQEELARKANISAVLVSLYERGQHFPRKGTLDALAKALNCDVRDII